MMTMLTDIYFMEQCSKLRTKILELEQQLTKERQQHQEISQEVGNLVALTL